jgi:MOSC domain-containing protein YiiM
MIKQFHNSDYPGVYVRVLTEGNVKSGDELKLKERTEIVSIKEVYSLFSYNKNNSELAEKTFSINSLSEDCKNSLRKTFNI